MIGRTPAHPGRSGFWKFASLSVAGIAVERHSCYWRRAADKEALNAHWRERGFVAIDQTVAEDLRKMKKQQGIETTGGTLGEACVGAYFPGTKGDK